MVICMYTLQNQRKLTQELIFSFLNVIVTTIKGKDIQFLFLDKVNNSRRQHNKGGGGVFFIIVEISCFFQFSSSYNLMFRIAQYL